MKLLLPNRILPAVTFGRVEDAVPTANAFLEGGLNLIEIPFRTPVAATCISELVKKLPEMHIGAGTILTCEQVHQAKETGAEFGLAPGFNPKIVEEAAKINFPFIPGIMTPSEMELAYEMGCTILKLFPIEQMGGIRFVQSLLGPYKHLNLRFIPMGGINLGNMKDYLVFKEVASVGGSWLATPKLIINQEFETIRKNVADALLQIN